MRPTEDEPRQRNAPATPIGFYEGQGSGRQHDLFRRSTGKSSGRTECCPVCGGRSRTVAYSTSPAEPPSDLTSRAEPISSPLATGDFHTEADDLGYER
jgi:hypothetical protein